MPPSITLDRFFHPVPRLLSLTADRDWTNSPSTELPKLLTGYGANANGGGGGVKHVVLVEARILSETAAVLSGRSQTLTLP